MSAIKIVLLEVRKNSTAFDGCSMMCMSWVREHLLIQGKVNACEMLLIIVKYYMHIHLILEYDYMLEIQPGSNMSRKQ